MTEKKDDISGGPTPSIRESDGDVQLAKPLTPDEICQRRQLALLQARMLLELLADKCKT
jgi:hypothetical protein